MSEDDIPGDKWFICSVCAKKSRTGHFKWRLCHNCYLNRVREADERSE